jgi:hypothetical protein
MFPRASKLRIGVGGACFGMVLACNQILNIEEASYDARLENSGRPAAAGAGGSGGSLGGSTATAGTGGSDESGGSDGTGGAHLHSGGSANAGGEGDSEPAGNAGKGSSSAGSGHDNHGSGDAGSDGEGEGGSGGDDSGNEPMDPCETYCDEMNDQCQGAAAQYIDKNQCLKVCRLFPAGVSDGPDDNSVACRLKYAQKAHYALGSEVTAYCRQAGPSGEGRCGSVCEAFCSLMATVCTEDTAGPSHFASNEDCRSTCETLPPASVSYSTSDPLIADGNHALCRLFHVTSAAMADPEEHCEHALGVTLCEAPAF